MNSIREDSFSTYVKSALTGSGWNFDSLCMEVFNYQAAANPVYRNFLSYLKIVPSDITQPSRIPFLPISFFKSQMIVCSGVSPEIVFTTSGTTGADPGRHFIGSLRFYKKIFLEAFNIFYGDIKHYCILALLPSYLERTGSSLIYMVDEMIRETGNSNSGFYLHDLAALKQKLDESGKMNHPVLLIGVTYALLDLAEKFPGCLENVTVMETGGMKGKRREMVREEVHGKLQQAFGVPSIHSEYGMTELLSQAYSAGNGIFKSPPWMRVLIRDINDPFGGDLESRTGAINIIDLANVDSCAFIATQDVGKNHPDGSFEVLGRFDESDLRGCNLLVD